MTAIQVKCYLFPDHVSVEYASISKANEIRRFNLATDGSKGIYDQLVDKILQSFGDLLPNRECIRTYWQDDENELVGFSSDTELQYAIDLQTAIRMSKPYDRQQGALGAGNLFKVYVARKKVEAAKESEEKEPIHFGVVCDSCNGSIVGTRYKCAICPDYDLCSACKTKGAHRDTEHAFNTIEKPNFWRPFNHRRGPGGRCPYKSQCRSQQQQPSAEGASASASANANAGFQNPFGSFFAPLMTGANVPLVNDPEQLKTLGESLKKFLDPFGIDVDYYVDSFSRAARSGSTENKPAEKKESESTTGEKRDQEMKVDETPKQEPTQMDVEKQDATPAATANVPASAAPKVSEDADLIKLNASSPFAAASEALSTFLEKQKESENVKPNAPTEEPVTTPKYPHPNETQQNETIEESFNLVDIEKELKIIKAIEQLKSMGYSDDGGWLTRLATAKEGNINAVLDAISPSLPHTRP